MRQETLGVSRFRQFVLMGVVGEVALAGLITGVVFAVLHPPMLTSTGFRLRACSISLLPASIMRSAKSSLGA